MLPSIPHPRTGKTAPSAPIRQPLLPSKSHYNSAPYTLHHETRSKSTAYPFIAGYLKESLGPMGLTGPYWTTL